MLDVSDSKIKIHNLMLKQIFMTYSIDDIKTMYKNFTTNESDLLLLCSIYDLLNHELGFFSLSREVTQKIEDVFQLLRWKIKDTQMLPMINESIICFNEIYNQSDAEKEILQRQYLRENFKIRTQTDHYFEKLLDTEHNQLDHIISYNLDFQRYDYSFYLSAQRGNFDYMMKEKEYSYFIFSLNYLIDYTLPVLFTEDKKEVYLDLLYQIVLYDQDRKKYVKKAKKHLRQI